MRTRDYLLLTFVVLMYTLHPFLTKRSMLTFNCRRFNDAMYAQDSSTSHNSTSLRLTSDLTVDCSDGSTIAWMLLLGLPMLVVYVAAARVGGVQALESPFGVTLCG